MKKLLAIGILGGLALGGFMLAKHMTNGGKGTPVVPSVRYAEVTATNATLYESGAPLVTLSAADKTAAIDLVHARMKADGVGVYFIFTQVDDGSWWATGYKEGASASDDMGPYADQALAMQAGAAWVQSNTPAVASAAVGARGQAGGGSRIARRPGWRRDDQTVEHGSDAFAARREHPPRPDRLRSRDEPCPDGFIRGPDGNCWKVGTPVPSAD